MIMRVQEKETVRWWKVSGRKGGRLLMYHSTEQRAKSKNPALVSGPCRGCSAAVLISSLPYEP